MFVLKPVRLLHSAKKMLLNAHQDVMNQKMQNFKKYV